MPTASGKTAKKQSHRIHSANRETNLSVLADSIRVSLKDTVDKHPCRNIADGVIANVYILYNTSKRKTRANEKKNKKFLKKAERRPRNVAVPERHFHYAAAPLSHRRLCGPTTKGRLKKWTLSDLSDLSDKKAAHPLTKNQRVWRFASANDKRAHLKLFVKGERERGETFF